MLSNHTQEIRECYQQATHCVRQAEAQNDPKVQKQFLELTRRWLLLAQGYETSPQTTQAPIEENNPDVLDNSGNCILRPKDALTLAGQTKSL